MFSIGQHFAWHSNFVLTKWWRQRATDFRIWVAEYWIVERNHGNKLDLLGQFGCSNIWDLHWISTGYLWTVHSQENVAGLHESLADFSESWIHLRRCKLQGLCVYNFSKRAVKTIEFNIPCLGALISDTFYRYLQTMAIINLGLVFCSCTCIKLGLLVASVTVYWLRVLTD